MIALYFDEELLLDVRFNILDKFVDRFVMLKVNIVIEESQEIQHSILIIFQNLKIKLSIFY